MEMYPYDKFWSIWGTTDFVIKSSLNIGKECQNNPALSNSIRFGEHKDLR